MSTIANQFFFPPQKQEAEEDEQGPLVGEYAEGAVHDAGRVEEGLFVDEGDDAGDTIGEWLGRGSWGMFQGLPPGA